MEAIRQELMALQFNESADMVASYLMKAVEEYHALETH